MVRWKNLEAVVERAVSHFAAVGSIEATDADVCEMAARHRLQCGTREFAEALSMLSRLHLAGAGYSLLSDDLRTSYRALRRLEGEELLSPSDIDPRIIQDARAAAIVLSEYLQPDIERIRAELSISGE